jgi:hypothetical protein
MAITQQRIISPFTPKVSPIKIAALCYKKWGEPVPFIDDLDDYMLNGVVISLPYLFAMAKVIDVAPEGSKEREPAWFVRMAVGNLAMLLKHLPCYLPKICFCRRNDGRMRVYSTARLLRLAVESKKDEVGIKKEGM